MVTFFHAHRAARVRSHHLARATAGSPSRARWFHLAIPGVATLAGAALVVSLTPPVPASDAELVAAYNDRWGQSMTVPSRVEEPEVVRDGYEATPGIETLKAGGTNHDWARMILLFAGWPMTDDSVTVITRWMRQENYVDDWWLRNNPLNNGWGATGGNFLGGNPDLVDAARDVADALTTNPGYSGIAAAFGRGAPSAEIERAIWDSPWATGHYNDGAHWHYDEVPEITAPASAWG